MSLEEIEIDARLIEILEERGSFDVVEDEELIEIIEDIKQLNDGDNDEAYEYINQYAPIEIKRFLSLCLD